MANQGSHFKCPGVLSSEIVYLPLDAIRENPNNTHTHSRRHKRQIADSIREFGFLRPLLLDEHNMLLYGHGSLGAARLLKLETVPVVRASGLSDTQKRLFMIADNKLTENAGWDRGKLAMEFEALLDQLAPINLDLTITGFSVEEICPILDDQGRSAPDPADTVPAIQDNVVTRPGDRWILGAHVILCGDARSEADLYRLMEGIQARMGFTDPPYNVKIHGHVQGRGRVKHRDFLFGSGEMTERQFVAFLKASFSNMARHCTDGAIVFAFTDWRHLPEFLEAAKLAFTEYKNLIVWNKTSPGQGLFYRSQHELVGAFKVGTGQHINSFGMGGHGRTRSNVWTYPGSNSFHAGRAEDLAMHPTVKPIGLITDAMRDCSMKGDVVLDPFLGSGSTVIAAEKIGRRAYGMDCDPAYIDVAIRRWQAYTRVDAVLAADGRTFEEVETKRHEASASLKKSRNPKCGKSGPPLITCGNDPDGGSES